MKVNPTTAGTSTYALKKAMEMPNTLLRLIQNQDDSGASTLKTSPPALTATAPSQATAKGAIIDIIV